MKKERKNNAAQKLLTLIMSMIRAAGRRYSERAKRRRAVRSLRESMEGFTLNSLGPIFGVKRRPGEPNRRYKRRILKAVWYVDTVNPQNAPTPGRDEIDMQAKKLGVFPRRAGETDTQYHARIVEAAGQKIRRGKYGI